MVQPESQRLAREILVAERALKVQVAREHFAETLTERVRKIEQENGGNTHG